MMENTSGLIAALALSGLLLITAAPIVSASSGVHTTDNLYAAFSSYYNARGCRSSDGLTVCSTHIDANTVTTTISAGGITRTMNITDYGNYLLVGVNGESFNILPGTTVDPVVSVSYHYSVSVFTGSGGASSPAGCFGTLSSSSSASFGTVSLSWNGPSVYWDPTEFCIVPFMFSGLGSGWSLSDQYGQGTSSGLAISDSGSTTWYPSIVYGTDTIYASVHLNYILVIIVG